MSMANDKKIFGPLHSCYHRYFSSVGGGGKEFHIVTKLKHGVLLYLHSICALEMRLYSYDFICTGQLDNSSWVWSLWWVQNMVHAAVESTVQHLQLPGM